MKKRIALITNAHKDSGVGSRAYHIAKHIGEQDDLSVTPVFLDGKNNRIEIDGETVTHISSLPSFLGSKSVSWVRLARHVPTFDAYDLSNQTLSFMANKRRPSIITVHDLIELTEPQDLKASLLNTYLLSGISSADRLVAVSEYTKQRMCEYFHISESVITVIPNGVSDVYSPLPNFASSIGYQELLQSFRLGDRHPLLISVGSEHPRKNLETTLRTVGILKKQYPNILLLKVGDPGIPAGRKHTLEMIDTFGLQKNVRLLGNIPSERINELYNIADALLFPSRAEGFGLPPLEAMAAGCPVVCSNTTSLPEVVGDAASMHESDDATSYATSISHILSNEEFRNTLITKGIERAKLFPWEKAARDMLAVYRSIV